MLLYIAMAAFKRTISSKDPVMKYRIGNVDDNLKAIDNCHFGAMKLFYSEVEFLLKCSRYVDINECLVLYIGAQPGYRLKHLFIKEYFPDIKMLLYDPLKFDIDEDEQIIIKTGDDGWFNDDKIEEVLKIANGRKILYISDIRIADDDPYKKELLIYEDLIKQQRWAVNLGADFILLKFRMFFYQNHPDDIDFIDNNLINDIKDKVIFNFDKEKHGDKHNWMLYLSGKIYSQILAGTRSSETRLFIKKIKYHKKFDKIQEFSNKFDKAGNDVGEKYLLKYYSNINYEEVLNYYNIVTRQRSFSNTSNRISDYIIGLNDDYTANTIYCITVRWMKYNKIDIKFNSVLLKIIEALVFFYKRYNNNLAVCVIKQASMSNISEKKKIMQSSLLNKINIWNAQIKKLYALDIDRYIIDNYINSHKISKNMPFDIKNNVFILRS